MEFILTPTVNPRDNQHIYYKAPNGEAHKETYDYLESRDIAIFHVKNFDWRVDQGIGIRTSVSDE